MTRGGIAELAFRRVVDAVNSRDEIALVLVVSGEVPVDIGDDFFRCDLQGFFVEDVGAIDIVGLAPLVQRDPLFPRSVNVGVATLLSADRIRLSVYERGAGLTQACGSGACAAVASGIARGLLDAEVDVELLGGHLTIQWQGKGTTLAMTGNACRVFDGKIKL